MPKRPPTLTERLRSAWAQRSARPTGSPTDPATPASAGEPGNEFADRLRAAVATRR